MDKLVKNDLVIPTTYQGILDFIQEHRSKILQDFNLIVVIYDTLDNMLVRANTMGDLHKDTRIILETIQLQLDSFIKEFKNEINFEKLIEMAENNELDDFFIHVKRNSQKMVFVDALDFNFQQGSKTSRRDNIKYDTADGVSLVPDEVKTVENSNVVTLEIQNIKNRVLDEQEVEFYAIILDRDSFTQTIKNAFNLALALRMKQVSIVMSGSNLMVVPFDGTNQELNHSVFELTPAQYEVLKKKL